MIPFNIPPCVPECADYVAQAIRESGYTGSLMLEVGNKTRYGEMDPREFIEESYRRITKLRAMVDGE